jgi:hypothetical protein
MAVNSGGKAVGLDGQHHRVGFAKVGGAIAGRQAQRFAAVAVEERQAVGAQCGQRVAARQHGHFGAAAGEDAGKPAANGAGADHENTHQA